MNVLATLVLLIAPCWASRRFVSHDSLPKIGTLGAACDSAMNVFHRFAANLREECQFLDPEYGRWPPLNVTCACKAEQLDEMVLYLAMENACTNETEEFDLEEHAFEISIECTQNAEGDYCKDIVQGEMDGWGREPPSCDAIANSLGCCAGTAWIYQCGDMVKSLNCSSSTWENYCEGSPTECYEPHDHDDHDEGASMTTSAVNLFSVISLLTVGLFA